MNSQQAKFILRGYRPNGADAGDPAFGEALEQARNDPALHEWLAREQAFDAAISSKLDAVAAPAGLREAILAGARFTAADTPRRNGWHPAWMAVAAGVAIIFSLTFALWPKPAVASNELLAFALTDARHPENHGGSGEKAGALQAALSQPSTRLGDRLPVDFATLRNTGCRKLGFNGHEVLEVCFQRDGIWFHCYIAQRADFPTMVASAIPALADKGKAGSATWTDATYLYVLVSEAGRSALEKLL